MPISSTPPRRERGGEHNLPSVRRRRDGTGVPPAKGARADATSAWVPRTGAASRIAFNPTHRQHEASGHSVTRADCLANPEAA